MSDERIEKKPGVQDEDTAIASETEPKELTEQNESAESEGDIAATPEPEPEPEAADLEPAADEVIEADDAGADEEAPLEAADEKTNLESADVEPTADILGAEELEPVAETLESADPEVTAEDQPYEGVLPEFLARDENGNFGDDPEPLPEGFEVIDGGVPANGSLAAEPQSDTAPAPTEPKGPSAAETFAHNAAEAASTVGTYIQQGVGAVREMRHAKRAHAEARDMLEELEERIASQTEELAYRRDVTERYPEIVNEQTTRKKGAQAAANAAIALQKTITGQIETLKKQLDDMKASDAATEKRLKSALEAAERKEEEARESANRMKRRLTDAQRGVEKAREAGASSVETAQHAVEAATARLNTLREEYAEIQRNPSANSAAYSIRDNELAAEIADATEELRRANEELPRVQADAEASLAAAQEAVAESERPIAEAKEAFRTVTDQTAAARDALDAARKDASSRQKALKSKISDQERDLKEQQEAQASAEAEIAEADRVIADAASIHDNPDVTERIASALAADTAERDDQLQQVQSLAAAEASVRELTRESRMRFIGIIAVAIVIILIIVAIALFIL